MFIQSSPFRFHKLKTIQALRYHFIQRKEIKVLLILVNVFALFSAGMYYSHKISPFAFLISSLLWFLLMLSFWFFMPRLIFRKTRTFQDQFEVTLTDQSFSLKHPRAEKEWALSDFFGWMESPHFLHLYFTEKSFFLIPKEAFSDDELISVRTTLRKSMTLMR
jgi:hypothetical protein